MIIEIDDRHARTLLRAVVGYQANQDLSEASRAELQATDVALQMSYRRALRRKRQADEARGMVLNALACVGGMLLLLGAGVQW